jgi:two-component system nitrate/nitrite response regulator NarL
MAEPCQSHYLLTPREQALVAEIRAGRSNRAIAAQFGIKEQTVRNQLTVLFRKVGVSSRLELAVKCRSHQTER